jgi:pimeloyl-ACP methyl ester carboxylesterase
MESILDESNLESRCLTLEGKKVHYVVAGAGAPLILLPGWPASSRIFHDLMPSLAFKYYVIALDFPGWGGESEPSSGRHDLEFYVEFLHEFISALNLNRIDLVGVSTGGLIALKLAERYSTLVNKVIVQSPPYDSSYKLEHETQHQLLKFMERFPETQLIAEWIFKSELNRWKFILEFHPVIKQSFKPLLNACYEDIKKLDPRAVAETGMSVLETDYTEDFRRVSTPVLVLSGDHDRSVPWQVSRNLAEIILPNARFQLIPNATHLLVLFNSEILTDIVLGFLQEPDLPPEHGPKA